MCLGKYLSRLANLQSCLLDLCRHSDVSIGGNMLWGSHVRRLYYVPYKYLRHVLNMCGISDLSGNVQLRR